MCCLFALFCVACALIGKIDVAAVWLAACAACFVAASRARRISADTIESDALQFIDNILENYSDSVSTLTLLERSLNSRFAFYGDMQRAIRTYALSANAEHAFSVLLGYDSYALRGLVSTVRGRLEEGAELRMQLVELKRHIMLRNSKKLESIGTLGSALSISQIGSVLFFPIFAGISLNIMRFAASMQAAAHANTQALIAVFAFYIMYLNLLNLKYDTRESAAVRAEKAALSCAVAMLVFRATSVLSAVML